MDPGPDGLDAKSDASATVVGRWVAFQNQTCNGTYWAIHRVNRAFLDGYQVMLTRVGMPRRFGSQAAAEHAAAEANLPESEREEKPLTRAQKEFLASYVEDVCHGFNKHLKTADKDVFIRAVLGMEIDGRVDASELRVSKGLNTRGYFSTFKVQGEAPGLTKLCVEFSPRGAEAVWMEMLRARA
ncbi:hypothetical protein [Paucibacter soli]|uniref:hypothetical protein n=1 Tax=Paucibacter soli TaxID=3133433 RepID=UPI0030AC9A61